MKQFIQRIAIFLNFVDPPTTKVLETKGSVVDKQVTLTKYKSLFIVEKVLLSKQGVKLASNTMMIATDDAKQLAKFIYEHI